MCLAANSDLHIGGWPRRQTTGQSVAVGFMVDVLSSSLFSPTSGNWSCLCDVCSYLQDPICGWFEMIVSLEKHHALLRPGPNVHMAACISRHIRPKFFEKNLPPGRNECSAHVGVSEQCACPKKDQKCVI